MKRYLTLLLISLLAFGATASAQKIAVKTNALYLATTTPNLGFEFAMGDRWTFELSGGYNPWILNKDKNIKLKHFLVSPEIKYWFCEAFNGHFLELHGNYTMFNAGGIHVPNLVYKPEGNGIFMDSLRDSRLEGWAAGAGIGYGYSWLIGPRWNMEFNIGVGAWYTDAGRYESRLCGFFQETVNKWAFGLTDIGLSFIYLIK